MKINYKKIQNAASELQHISSKQQNNFLEVLEQHLSFSKQKIILANLKDVKAAKKNNLSSAFVERLQLSELGIDKIVQKLRSIRKLESGIGEIIEQKIIDNGITLLKRRTSIGVIGCIYESRPEVTIDVAALCIKSGNVAILKGGSEAINTNKALYKCVQKALEDSSLSINTITFISRNDRIITDTLLKMHDYIDLIIARGGYGLVNHVLQTSTIPVLAHAAGGARIYIDKSANISIIEDIILNAKTTKPSACNSLDTILIHTDIAHSVLPKLQEQLQQNNVKILHNDWDREFMDLIVNIKIVNSINEAIQHIRTYTKNHSEGIIAEDKKAIKQFTQSINAAAVFVNCSTRLHDGYIFGLGSEMGIATGKLHARGPVGLKELTTFKWELYGNRHTQQ